MKHEFNICRLCAQDTAHVGKCLGVCGIVKGIGVKTIGVRIGVKIARDLVVDTQEVVNIWKAG